VISEPASRRRPPATSTAYLTGSTSNAGCLGRDSADLVVAGVRPGALKEDPGPLPPLEAGASGHAVHLAARASRRRRFPDLPEPAR
jgi:hypothetical protein